MAQAGPSTVEPPYPLLIEGEVVRGFGRGSKDLGCPTANLADEVIAPFTSRLATGVHFGYARVKFSPDASTAHDRVLPMVMSVGWNPFYKNEKRTLEVHVLDDFPHDFYGHHLRIAILGFIRPEYNYTSMGALNRAWARTDRADALIRDIETDKSVARASLDRPAYAAFAHDPFFSRPYDA